MGDRTRGLGEEEERKEENEGGKWKEGEEGKEKGKQKGKVEGEKRKVEGEKRKVAGKRKGK